MYVYLSLSLYIYIYIYTYRYIHLVILIGYFIYVLLYLHMYICLRGDAVLCKQTGGPWRMEFPEIVGRTLEGHSRLPCGEDGTWGLEQGGLETRHYNAHKCLAPDIKSVRHPSGPSWDVGRNFFQLWCIIR